MRRGRAIPDCEGIQAAVLRPAMDRGLSGAEIFYLQVIERVFSIGAMTIPTASESESAIPSGLENLIRLFESELARVAFPGIDAAVLTAAADRVRAAAAEVARCVAALDVARAELNSMKDELATKGQRAMAYARIYAEDLPELQERLDSLTLPRLMRRGDDADGTLGGVGAGGPISRRRGRPRASTASSLFGAELETSSPLGSLTSEPMNEGAVA